MLIVFLHVEDYCSRNLHLRQKVKVSQDEENLALILIVLSHVLLIDEQVIFHVRVSNAIYSSISSLITVQDLILAEEAISKRENIVANLNHEEREVDVCQLKVYVSDLTTLTSVSWLAV